MEKENYNKSEAKDLRKRAEAELKVRKPTFSTDDTDNLILIHELRVNQIELEMQNEELALARDTAEANLEKFVDLYDFAPSGYLTVVRDGTIVNLNFSAAKLLGNDRKYLKDKHLGSFISPDSLALYNRTIENAYKDKSKQCCELFLLSKTLSLVYVHVDIHFSSLNNEYLLTMIDISELKRLEIELKNSLDHYKQLNSYFLDREMRMVDLKKEINALLVKSGCEEEYLIM